MKVDRIPGEILDGQETGERETLHEQGMLHACARDLVVRSDTPAVTHMDCSASNQTDHRETDPRLHALIGAFEAITDCPVVVKTCFNVCGPRAD